MSTFVGNYASIVDKYINLNNLRDGWIENLIINHPNERDSHSKLIKAGYEDPAWIGVSYWAHIHVPKELIFELDEIFGTICCGFNISEIDVGNVAPPHQDIEPREKKFKSEGIYKRFHIHLGEPKFGHAFFVDNTCHYMEKHGNTYIWDDPDAWHAGINAGLCKKYLLSYKGIKFHDNRKIEYDWWTENNENGCIILWKDHEWLFS